MAVNHSISQAGKTEDFDLQVARGHILNHRHVFKYGFNSAVGTGDETIWAQGAQYTWPAAAAQLKVSSSSVEDDATKSPEGTGAYTVTLEGLDANYAEISETVTMNGQTQVTTTASFLRLHRMYVVTAGSTLSNVGIIYAYTGTASSGTPTDATTIRSTIAAAEGQTLQAFYTVPAGYTAYMTNISAGSVDGTNATTMTLRARNVGESFRTKMKFIVFKSHSQLDRHIPLKFLEKTDIEVRGDAAASTTDVAATFDLILIKN